MKVVVIGAVAAGPRAAARFKRLCPEGEVILIDRDDIISYGGCGIPYYVSGDVADESDLRKTAFHMLRDENFFRNAKGLEVLTRTEAIKIDREKKEVKVKELDSGRVYSIAYDKLVLTTGTSPRKIPIAGVELEGVYTVGSLKSAIAIKEKIARGEVEKAVVIGGGAIGIEMAEALADMWGIEVVLVEYFPRVLSNFLDPPISRIVEHHLREHGIRLRLNARIKEIQGREGKVDKVILEDGAYDADMVIMATGVTPNSDLAREAGLVVSPVTGGIVVNERMQTSDPDIYAGGDCVEVKNMITGRFMLAPLGSVSNRQGRIIGTNLAGGTERFEGFIGAFIMKFFDMAVASCGITYENALKEGFDAIYALHNQTERAHFFPGADFIFLNMITDRKTRRVLGVQCAGPCTDGTLARINSAVSLVRHGALLEEVAYAEFAYAPPFNTALDPLNVVAMVSNNMCDNLAKFVEWDEVYSLLKDSSQDVVFVDLRHPKEASPYVERYSPRWINVVYDEVRRDFQKIPRDKKIYMICNSSMRSYEAARVLYSLGFKEVYVPKGGLNYPRRWGWDIVT